MVGRWEEGPLCDPRSELPLERRARIVCEDNKWDEKKNASYYFSKLGTFVRYHCSRVAKETLVSIRKTQSQLPQLSSDAVGFH